MNNVVLIILSPQLIKYMCYVITGAFLTKLNSLLEIQWYIYHAIFVFAVVAHAKGEVVTPLCVVLVFFG